MGTSNLREEDVATSTDSGVSRPWLRGTLSWLAFVRQFPSDQEKVPSLSLSGVFLL